MKTNWKAYFYFSRTQRTGIVLLASLIMLFFIGGQLLPQFISKEVADHAEFEAEIAAFESELEKSAKDAVINKKHPTLFSLNPNTVTKEELIQLGLPAKVADTFMNYRKSGAKFYKKEDLQKVYGITLTDYQRLAPFIRFPTKKRNTATKSSKREPLPKPLTPFPFDPNIATKETFLNLGLSHKVTRTIINFRDKGGKFWKKEDFRKIYGIDSLTYLTLALSLIHI